MVPDCLIKTVRRCAAASGLSFPTLTRIRSTRSWSVASRLHGESMRLEPIKMLELEMNSLAGIAAVIDALERGKIEYMVVGAFAVNASGLETRPDRWPESPTHEVAIPLRGTA